MCVCVCVCVCMCVCPYKLSFISMAIHAILARLHRISHMHTYVLAFPLSAVMEPHVETGVACHHINLCIVITIDILLLCYSLSNIVLFLTMMYVYSRHSACDLTSMVVHTCSLTLVVENCC